MTRGELFSAIDRTIGPVRTDLEGNQLFCIWLGTGVTMASLRDLDSVEGVTLLLVGTGEGGRLYVLGHWERSS